MSGTVNTLPGVPAPADVIAGQATAANTASAQTLITVPAGRTWQGCINLSVYNGAATGTLVSATVQTAGTGVVPAAATGVLTVQAGTVGTVAGNSSNQNNTDDVTVVAPPGNAVTLTLVNSTATTMTSVANANGQLLQRL